ncbi:dTDP-4-dehydrorhamnose reductase [Desulfocurvus sp. DL9XJH121]
MTPHRALVLGGETGLLGRSLTALLEKQGWEASATPRPGPKAWDYEALGAFLDHYQPDVIFNTWAYTQVDKAEDEPAEARRVNAALPEALGRAALGRDITLVHFSTDFVFGGPSETPRTEEDDPCPESVYGRTKLEGEMALLSLGMPSLLVLRTAWLFGPGKGNFVRTMLNLAAERESINVVHDQVGSPTYTPDLAEYTLALVNAEATGLYHVANAGSASWCELASEALRCMDTTCAVHAITSAEYPQKAKRPAYSVLDTAKFTRATGITPRPWVQAVRDYVYRETSLGDG